MAAFRASRFENISATFGAHSSAEAMRTGAFETARLVRTLHDMEAFGFGAGYKKRREWY